MGPAAASRLFRQRVDHTDLGDRGIFYRIRTGPFPNRATAQDMCAQIEAAKLACLVVRDK